MRALTLAPSTRYGVDTRCGVENREIVIDAGRGAGGFLRAISVVQHPQARFALRKLSAAGAFEWNGLGV